MAGNRQFIEGRVLKVSSDGIITTLAKTGVYQQWPKEEQFPYVIYYDSFYPPGVAVDGAGNVFFAESRGGNRVHKISPDGIVSTVAGTGSFGFSGIADLLPMPN